MIDLRTEATLRDALLMRRLDTLVPRLLEETGIDCWVLIGREYAEDPVLTTMLPASWMTARRRTILVLTPEARISVSRYPVGELFASAWDPDTEPDQWRRLVQILDDIDPTVVGLGLSPIQAHADGLTAAEHAALMDALPERLATRTAAAGLLGVRWLETRLPEERPTMVEATRIAHAILRRGMSREAIEPGRTTPDDLVWWYRQTAHEAGLTAWFQPTVTVQRDGPPSDRIEPGDLLHVDFGIIYRGLCTDQQEHAYVLRTGEHDAPKGLTEGLQRANRIQDILLAEFVSGRTGNEILASALERANDEQLRPTIYTHGIGLHGHGAGVTIGLWDHQDGVPGAGDHPLHPDTAYSIELMGESDVAEWGGASIRFMLEQDAWFDGGTCSWLDGRQESLWLI